jgi:hypothetical protein
MPRGLGDDLVVGVHTVGQLDQRDDLGAHRVLGRPTTTKS